MIADVSDTVAFDPITQAYYDPATGAGLDDQDGAEAMARAIVDAGGIVVGLNDVEEDTTMQTTSTGQIVCIRAPCPGGDDPEQSSNLLPLALLGAAFFFFR